MKVANYANSVRFTSGGRVVIPASIRKQFQITKGTRVAVLAVRDGILLRPETAEVIRRGRGVLKRFTSKGAFGEERAEHKRTECQLEDRLVHRCEI